MGTILYRGDFDPQYYEANRPPYQNFTVTVPNSIATGNAQINIAHVALVGVSIGILIPTVWLRFVDPSITGREISLPRNAELYRSRGLTRTHRSSDSVHVASTTTKSTSYPAF